MTKRILLAGLCGAAILAAIWISKPGYGNRNDVEDWIEVAPGVLRSRELPASYVLLDGKFALLIDAPRIPKGLAALGVRKIELALLTHHHRDTCGAAGELLAKDIKVRAAKLAAAWLTPQNVKKYWQESLPLRTSQAAYLVVPRGFSKIDCSLVDGQTITWRQWTIRVLATPGHSRDHLTFIAQKGKRGRTIAFCGDALASPGKLWSPYTTDWDHWTDAGLTPTAQSLRKLAILKPDIVLPAHGQPIKKDTVAALTKTAEVVEEMAFLKSFERFTKKRLGKEPSYPFLVKEQAGSNGSKPFSKVSAHLYLTGNTYVLVSKDNACLVIDPWAPHSTPRIKELLKEQKLGPIEVVMFSHAHYDHYDGIYDLPGKDKVKIWSLDRVAAPIAEPLRWRAPFLDARPIRFDRRFKDGETGTWREYTFRFHHLPGQSEFTMGVETRIDGKKCFFTADNWFHQDQYSGSGGWMGLNRSWPLPYSASAQKVLDAKPDWVLAEHGGPFAFNAEDFRRRVRWGKVSAEAADALSPSGNHRMDWDPSRIHLTPLLQKAKAGATIQLSLVCFNPLARTQDMRVRLAGTDFTADQQIAVKVPGKKTVNRQIKVKLGKNAPLGRHVFTLTADAAGVPDPADVFFVVDVE